MFVIGVDPHKGSHTVAALDEEERVHGELRVRADRYQRRRLLAWAEPFTPRMWAVEGATGTGALLAQQLVAAGETVLDVPRRCRRERGSWTRAPRTRPIPTTPARPPSWPCATPGCEPSARRTTSPSSACWPSATTT